MHLEKIKRILGKKTKKLSLKSQEMLNRQGRGALIFFFFFALKSDPDILAGGILASSLLGAMNKELGLVQRDMWL